MAHVPYHDLLGIEIQRASEGSSRATLSLDPRKTNKRGVAHGGATASLLDAALGAAVVSHIPGDWWCATRSLSIEYIAPGRGPLLVAEGRVARREGRNAHVEGEARDDAGRLVARASAVFHIWEHHPDVGRASE